MDEAFLQVLDYVYDDRHAHLGLSMTVKSHWTLQLSVDLPEHLQTVYNSEDQLHLQIQLQHERLCDEIPPKVLVHATNSSGQELVVSGR